MTQAFAMPRDSKVSPVGTTKLASGDPATDGSRERLFSVIELRLFRYTAVLLCMVALAAMIVAVLWAFSWILSAFYNLLVALAVAGILALVLYPVVEFLETRLRLPHLLAVLLLLAALLVGFGGLVFLVAPVLVSQIVQLMTVLPDLLAGWQSRFTSHFPELSAMVSTGIANAEGEATQPVLQDTGRIIMSYLGLLAGIGFVPLFLFFALLSGGLLRGQAIELLSVFNEATQQKVLYFIDVFVGYVSAFFRGQLIIAMSMGVLYALTFTLIGLKFGVLVGMVLGLLNIVPYLGALIGLLVVLPMAYLQSGGGLQLLIMTALSVAAVQLIESWLLTPKIMANRSGLHPALVVISLFFWGTALGGITGMVLAVPLTAIFVAFWRELKATLRRVSNRPEA